MFKNIVLKKKNTWHAWYAYFQNIGLSIQYEYKYVLIQALLSNDMIFFITDIMAYQKN